MAWDPQIYDQYKTERAVPFYDLLALVKPVANMQVIDLGCGTGELTQMIAEKLPQASVLGIDSSEHMFEKAAGRENKRVEFLLCDVADALKLSQKWDLVLSNAALQWVDDHETVFPAIINTLNRGGQLAVQMPAQHHNITNILLAKLADEPTFRMQLEDFRRNSPVLSIDRYAEILFENGAKAITAFEKIYPLILTGTSALFDWVSGTALIPYLERLKDADKENFIKQYKRSRRSFILSKGSCCTRNFNTALHHKSLLIQ